MDAQLSWCNVHRRLEKLMILMCWLMLVGNILERAKKSQPEGFSGLCKAMRRSQVQLPAYIWPRLWLLSSGIVSHGFNALHLGYARNKAATAILDAILPCILHHVWPAHNIVNAQVSAALFPQSEKDFWASSTSMILMKPLQLESVITKPKYSLFVCSSYLSYDYMGNGANSGSI